MTKDEILEEFHNRGAKNPKELYEKNHHKWNDKEVYAIHGICTEIADTKPRAFVVSCRRCFYDFYGEMNGAHLWSVIIKVRV